MRSKARRKAVVVGAGDNGRSLLNILRLTGAEVLGFLDDARRGEVEGLPILGPMEWLSGKGEIECAVGIASSAARKAVVGRLRLLGASFLTVIHPAAILSPGVKLGQGVFVNAGAIVVHNASLGDFSNVNLACTVGHDCVLESYVTLSPGVNIGGRAVLREGVFAGLNAAINQDVEIGAWTKVALGAAVMKSVGPGKIVAGNPARVMGFVE
ncbi:MAG: acetyltransferase [Elusimicrobia bacterium]|nr:acetyltransferase [Elusimicrobiota bacterium]